MSDPWTEDELLARSAGKLPLAHSAPEYGEVEPDLAPEVRHGQLTTKKPWQFSLGRSQLVIVILCVCSAGLGALLHVNEDEFTMVALVLLILPSGVLILLGMTRGVYELYKAWRADQALWHEEPWQAQQTPVNSDQQPSQKP